MYEDFSGQARKVIQHAEQEARRRQQDYVGTEHLLAGVLREGSPAVAGLLGACGLDPQAILPLVEASLGSGSVTVTWESLPLTPSVKRALQHAGLEAARMQHPCVGPEHILLGVLCEEDGVAAGVLQSLGLTLPTLRREVVKRPPTENRDWMLRDQPAPVGTAAGDPSPRQLEALVSEEPLPPERSARMPGRRTRQRGNGRITASKPFPDRRRLPSDEELDLPVVDKQLRTLQFLVAGLGGALCGELTAPGEGALLGWLAGCVLAFIRKGVVGALAGCAAAGLAGWKCSGGSLGTAMVWGGAGLALGGCLGDWRRLPAPPGGLLEIKSPRETEQNPEQE
jgi:hypothetical protein